MTGVSEDLWRRSTCHPAASALPVMFPGVWAGSIATLNQSNVFNVFNQVDLS
jgi:hypothetical protein